MRFQVGSFMEDDIATASIGISLTVPLRIEIFLDLTNVQHNLMEDKVRISTDQGLSFGPGVNIMYPESGEPVVSKPVVGLSCFIPHIVRRYLRSGHMHELWRATYKFSEGELLIGLMKHVVKALVALKHICCVCGEQNSSRNRRFPVVPMPCEKNLCQALFAAWLAVAPLKRLPKSTFHDWLKKTFDQDSDIGTTMLTELIKAYGRTRSTFFPVGYEAKILHLENKLINDEVQGSWLELTVPEPENAEEENSPNTSDDSRKRKASGHGERTESRPLPLSRFGRLLHTAREEQDSSVNESELGPLLRDLSPTNSGSNDSDSQFNRFSIKENMDDTVTRMPSARPATVSKLLKIRPRSLFLTRRAAGKESPLHIFPDDGEEETATSASTSRLTGYAKESNKGN
jgi:hypothetical protein